MSAPLAPADAAGRILSAVRRQPPLRIPLDDALGSILAQDAISPLDIPPWTNSAMDGYAARAADVRGATASAPRRLRIVEVIPAGAFPSRAVGPGECARIFTGAPLPEGADSVIRQEDTHRQPGSRGAGEPAEVTILSDRDCGVNVRRRGEDVTRGAVVLPAGTELGAAQIGVLASMADAHPVVFRRPRVAILGSGDEIVDVDQPEAILAGKKIASSNSHTLHALVRLAGGIPVDLGIARDTPESLIQHLERAGDCDLLVTTAGVSVGDHDHLRAVMDRLGAEPGFWKLRMRPGAPVGFGILRGIPWIGLPGNPVSTMVTFELFVRPAIRKMMGHTLPFRRTVPVRVAEPIKLGPRLQHFLRAVVSPSPADEAARPVARLTGPQGSGILTSMAAANALLIIPEGQHETLPGTLGRAIVLNDPVHVEQAPW